MEDIAPVAGYTNYDRKALRQEIMTQYGGESQNGGALRDAYDQAFNKWTVSSEVRCGQSMPLYSNA